VRKRAIEYAAAVPIITDATVTENEMIRLFSSPS